MSQLQTEKGFGSPTTPLDTPESIDAFLVTLSGLAYFPQQSEYPEDRCIRAATNSAADKDLTYAEQLTILQQKLASLPDDQARIETLLRLVTFYYVKHVEVDMREQREKYMDTIAIYETQRGSGYKTGTLFYFLAEYGTAKQMMKLLDMLQEVFDEKSTLKNFILNTRGIVTHREYEDYDKNTTLPIYISKRVPRVGPPSYRTDYDSEKTKHLFLEKFELLRYLQQKFDLKGSYELYNSAKSSLPYGSWYKQRINGIFYENMTAQAEELRQESRSERNTLQF